LFLFRTATESDAEQVRQLVNSHELSVDPAVSTMGEDGVQELMSGYIDSSTGTVMYLDGNSQHDILAYIQLHPDKNRSLYFPDIYCQPDFDNLALLTETAVDYLVSETAALNPDWSIRAGVNTKDDLLRSTYEARGFELLRTYWMLSVGLDSSMDFPELPSNVKIRLVQDTHEDLSLLHSLHQDAFSNHFGFKPREREDWIALEKETISREAAGSVIIEVAGKPVGYLLAATEMAHENGGFVDTIGVIKSAQGSGYGKLLLKWTMAYNASQGRSKLDLNVDTGNSSGALRLYESLGFKPVSSWQQLELIRG